MKFCLQICLRIQTNKAAGPKTKNASFATLDRAPELGDRIRKQVEGVTRIAINEKLLTNVDGGRLTVGHQ